MKRLAWAAFFAAACAQAPRSAGPSAPPFRAKYAYRADVSAAPVLSVEASFDPGGSAVLSIAGDAEDAVDRVEVERAGAWVVVSKEHGRWPAPECISRCRVRYALDLRRVQKGFDGVARAGESFLAPTYDWLLHPDPIPRADFTVDVSPLDEGATTWRDAKAVGTLRDAGNGRHGFASRDFGEGTFVAFGKLRVARVDAAGVEVSAVALDGKLAMGEDGAASWVRDAAGCVASLYGGSFPVRRASVFLVPIAGADEPVFGKVLSLGGSSIMVLTGEDTPASFAHHDWILVHEMLHLGFPTFVGEGRWLDEGMATYYEPVLRTRMGWREPADLWRGFAREMRRGVPDEGRPTALEVRDSIDDWYWGGALFVWMADVRIREATGGKMSFDDVLRGVLKKGGDGEHVWSVADTLREGDAITGTSVLTEMNERYAHRGERVDLEAELRALGVDRTGPGDAITLHDDRPRAWVRKQITAKDGK